MVERSAEGDVEMGELSPRNPMEAFLKTIDEIRKRMERINKAIGDIEYHHRLVLNAVNVEEATRLGRIIDELVARTNKEAQFIRRTLKELTAETETMKEAQSLSPSDIRIRSNQQARYAKKFMATMNKFQAMQTTYQAKYRQALERQYLIVKPSAGREELDRLTTASEGTTLLNQQIFSMANRAQAQKQLAEMKERHHDIVAIERSIRELHQMFVDMAIIVEQQGELIDKVEDHVANTVEYTEHAAQEMRQAVVRQKSIQKKKWIIACICVILLAVVALVLYLSLDTGGGSRPQKPVEPPEPAPQPKPSVGKKAQAKHDSKDKNKLSGEKEQAVQKNVKVEKDPVEKSRKETKSKEGKKSKKSKRNRKHHKDQKKSTSLDEVTENAS